MENKFRVEARVDGMWNKVGLIREECFDKKGESILLNKLMMDDLEIFKKKKLRLFRIIQDSYAVYGHEIAEFPVWEIAGKKLYAIKNFQHSIHMD